MRSPLDDTTPWTFMSSRFDTPKWLHEWLSDEIEKIMADLPEDSPVRQLYEAMPKPEGWNQLEPISTPFTIQPVFIFRNGRWYQ